MRKLARCSFILIMIMAALGCQQKPGSFYAQNDFNFPLPPHNFNHPRPNSPAGHTDTLHYESSTVGSTRTLLVYTPPAFDKSKIYPVLYLLHGIAGDEYEWYNNASPNIILDNLINDQKITPMIVVFPNGRAMKYDSAGGNALDRNKIYAFTRFEQDLLKDIIPFIESNYPVIKAPEGRALAGLSLGGGQALKFGFRNLHVFAWIGAFSPAGTWPPNEMIPDPTDAARKLKLLYLSCGNQDPLLFVSQQLHGYLSAHHFPHIYQINPGEHNFDVWSKDLYHFTQLIFR